MAHVILHLTLCRSMAELPPGASMPIAIHMADATGRETIDKHFVLERGTSLEHTVEFDAPQGAFRANIRSAPFNCNALDYWAFIPGQTRSIAESLVNGYATDREPTLFYGLAPQSFMYLNPTYVYLDKNTPCNGKINNPLPAHIDVEDDQSSFYVWLYSDPSLQARGGVLVALQLETPTGEYHYIRLKMTFPTPWGGFPNRFTMNVTDDAVDWLSGQPVDTLLCPRIFRTSVW